MRQAWFLLAIQLNELQSLFAVHAACAETDGVSSRRVVVKNSRRYGR